MKILLLDPKTIYETWPQPTAGLKFLNNSYGVTFPQLCATIPQYDCDIFNGLAEHCNLKEYFRMLSNYDVIGISVVAAVLSLNVEITIKVIKEIDRNKVIILGGHHATAYHKEWIQKGADIVIRNESEVSFPLVIEALSKGKSLSGINGITYREADEIKVNKDMDFIENLDTLPLPRWDRIKLFKSASPSEYKKYSAFFETSRGCTNECVFCSIPPMWRNIQRFKSAERVIKEFEYLYDLGMRSIEIADDNFGAFYERDKEIFLRVINKNMDISIGALMRPDSVLRHPDLIELGARAGLDGVCIGFESCDDTELDIYNKRLTNMRVRDYLEVYKILRQNGVLVFGSFVDTSLQEKSHSNKTDISKICDIPLWAEYIPAKDHIWFSELTKKNLIATDTFYHIRYLSPYNKTKTKTDINHFLRSLSVINLNAIGYIFFGSPSVRRTVFNIYKLISKHLFFRFSFRRITDLFICFSKKYSPQEKQAKILSRYLKDSYILKLCSKAKVGRYA